MLHREQGIEPRTSRRQKQLKIPRPTVIRDSRVQECQFLARQMGLTIKTGSSFRTVSKARRQQLKKKGQRLPLVLLLLRRPQQLVEPPPLEQPLQALEQTIIWR